MTAMEQARDKRVGRMAVGLSALLSVTCLAGACATDKTMTKAQVLPRPTQDFPEVWLDAPTLWTNRAVATVAQPASGPGPAVEVPQASATTPAPPSADAPVVAPLPPAAAPIPAPAPTSTVVASPTLAPGPCSTIDGQEKCDGPVPWPPPPAAPPPPSGCRSDLDCRQGTTCQGGECVVPPRRRRFQITADVMPLVDGSWSTDSGKGYSGASGSLSTGMSFGATLEWFRQLSRMTDLGFYVGFVRTPKLEASKDGNPDAVVGAESRFTLLRVGGIVRAEINLGNHLLSGVSVDGGLVAGKIGDTAAGLDAVPSLFFDIPLGSGPSRAILTAAVGLDIGVAFSQNNTSKQTATFIYAMYPVLRLGVGFGR